ncbi:MAG: hypothetical protein ACOC3C_07775 [Candidatus Thorarchaeota archaeon]
MHIYEFVPQFDPYTGEPTDPERVYKETRCDFCGDVIEGHEQYPFMNLYYGNCDPCFGSDGIEFELGEEFGISMYEFLSAPYTYCRAWDIGERFCEPELVKLVGPTSTLADEMREARVRAARKLIESGIISPDNLKEDI